MDIKLKITRMGGTRGYTVASLSIGGVPVREFDLFAAPGETDEQIEARILASFIEDMRPYKLVTL